MRGVDPAIQHSGPQEVHANWPTVYEKDTASIRACKRHGMEEAHKSEGIDAIIASEFLSICGLHYLKQRI